MRENLDKLLESMTEEEVKAVYQFALHLKK